MIYTVQKNVAIAKAKPICAKQVPIVCHIIRSDVSIHFKREMAHAISIVNSGKSVHSAKIVRPIKICETL